MPVHETKGGYKYGETGKTYKNKKDAVKQAIAIAYSKAKEKGRKPSQEEIKEEISGNPDKVKKTASAERFNSIHGNMTMDRNQMLRNYAGRLRKKASVLEKQARWGEWASAAGKWLSQPDNVQLLARLGIGAGVGLGTYGLTGLLDPKKKNRLLRAAVSSVPAILAATKGYDLLNDYTDLNDRIGERLTRRARQEAVRDYQNNQDAELAIEALRMRQKHSKTGKDLAREAQIRSQKLQDELNSTGPYGEDEPRGFRPLKDPTRFDRATKLQQYREDAKRAIGGTNAQEPATDYLNL